MSESERKKLLDEITEIQRTLGEVENEDSSSAEASSLHFNPNAKDDAWSAPCTSYFSTERSATSFEEALKLNRVYQKLLLEQITEVEILLETTREKQKIVQEKFEAAVKKRKRVSGVVRLQKAKSYVVFGMPYFKSKDGFCQPANEDTKIKMQNGDLDPLIKPPKPWLTSELEALEKAIRESSLQQALQPFMAKKEILYEKLERNLTSEEKDDIRNKLEIIEVEIKSIKSKSSADLFDNRDKKHDWLKISTIDLLGERSPVECELMWMNFLHPSINKTDWTPEEQDKLTKLVDENGNDWQKISELLNTGRTDYQCMEKFQSDLNPALLKSAWTQDEDELLKEVVEACRVGDFIPWHQVTYYMEGRTSAQVARRWQYHLDPVIKKGQWTLEEDMLLVLLVEKYGSNYSKLKEYMQGRTDSQIRERYVNVLDKAISYDCWTEEEDDTIVQLYRQMGSKWSEMATLFPRRTDGQIAKRLLRIKAHTEKEGYDFSETYIRPRTLNSTKWKKYRDSVYVRLKRLSKTNERKLQKTKAQTNDSVLLKTLNQNECLQVLIQQQEAKMQKPLRKLRRRGLTTSPTDKALVDFFKMVGRKSHGRPFVDVPIEDSDPVYKRVKNLFLQTLGSKIDPENLTLYRRLPTGPKKNLEVPFLPPMISSLLGFKSLLMFRNRLKFLARKVSVKNEEKRKRKGKSDMDSNKRKKLMSENEDLGENSTSTIPDPESTDDVDQCNEKSNSFVNRDGLSDLPYNESFEAFLKTTAYQQLLNRFIAIFFWPALLSTLNPLPDFEPEKNRKASKKKAYANHNRRRVKKPWVAERMKEMAKIRWGDNPKPDAPIKKNEGSAEDVANKKKRGRPFGSKTKKRPEPTVQRRSGRISKTFVATDG